MVRTSLGVLAGCIAIWVLAACVTAFFVLRGASWARVLLLVFSAVAGLCLLLGAVTSPVAAVPLAIPLVGTWAVFALLLRREVVAWFAVGAKRPPN
jgi:hypothetical protein